MQPDPFVTVGDPGFGTCIAGVRLHSTSTSTNSKTWLYEPYLTCVVDPVLYRHGRFFHPAYGGIQTSKCVGSKPSELMQGRSHRAQRGILELEYTQPRT